MFALVALGAASLFGFLTPYFVKLYHMPSYVFIDNVGKTLANIGKPPIPSKPRGETAPGPVTGLRFASIFTALEGEAVQIPEPERAGRGGALTSWGDDIVLLTHEGKIYVVGADLQYKLTKITPPRNGFEDYLAATKRPPHNGYKHLLENFRYIDIKAFSSAGRRGLVVSYTKFHAEKICYTTAISRLYIDSVPLRDLETSADQWTDIFQTSPCLPVVSHNRGIAGHMAGGRMAVDSKGVIYLASGEYRWGGRHTPSSITKSAPPLSQDETTDYGKVIAIEIDTGAAQHISRGHRNTQGITIDRDGALWAVEHGPRGGDELNFIVKDGNYGWPLEIYGTLYSGEPVPDTLSLGRHETYRRPAIAWLPSIAVSGLTHIDNFHAAWDGDLLASTLGGQMLVRIRTDSDRVVFTEFIKIGQRIRHVHQHTDGRIALWTENNQLIFLSPAGAGPGYKYIEARLAKMKSEDGSAENVQLAIETCMECHIVDIGENHDAPSLARIYGSKIGKTAFANYSENMRKDDRIWTRELLIKFVKSPSSVIPNTNMPETGIDDPLVLKHVVDILEGLAAENRIPGE